MVEIKQAFIKPTVAIESVAATPKPTQGFDPTLGASGPHQGDDAFEAEVAAELDPGAPPKVDAEGHYTNLLDELWIEFDDVEERTAARLMVVADEVGDEALRVHHVALDLFERTPEFKLPTSERDRFRAEFLAYAKRIRAYKDELRGLDPESTDTDDVYVGLIKRRPKAGPVPDAIMHLYFADQLGILSDHARSMGQGFIGRVMTGLDAAGSAVIDAAEAVEEHANQASDAAQSLWDQIRLFRWWILGGTAATIGTSVGLAVALTRESDEP